MSGWAATWRQRGGNGKRQKHTSSRRRCEGGNLQLRQPTLIISSVTETSRAIFGASPPFDFRYQHDAPSPRQKPRSLQPHLVIPRQLAFFLPDQNHFLSRNQSRWLQQSRVLCPLTSSLATPLATATRLSLPESTMARLDRTWLVLYAILNMPSLAIALWATRTGSPFEPALLRRLDAGLRVGICHVPPLSQPTTPSGPFANGAPPHPARTIDLTELRLWLGFYAYNFPQPTGYG